MVLETDADEAPRRAYVHGTQYIDERVLVRLPTGTEYYYLPRELYSVAALTDETGAIVEAATYDTYGKVAVYNGAAQAVEESPVGNPYYFTGRRLDLLPTASAPQPVTKQLYHYRARAYDPENGRFLQRDPVAMQPSAHQSVTIGFTESQADGEPDLLAVLRNLYETANSSPTVYVDPSGKGAVGGGLIGGCAMWWHKSCRECVELVLPRANSLLQSWINEHGGDSCDRDAMQHCIAQGLVRKECGWFCAYAAGTGNEIQQGDAENERDHDRDYHNNAEGRDCGGKNESDNGVVSCCQEKLRDDTLDTDTDHPDGSCP